MKPVALLVLAGTIACLLPTFAVAKEIEGKDIIEHSPKGTERRTPEPRTREVRVPEQRGGTERRGPEPRAAEVKAGEAKGAKPGPANTAIGGASKPSGDASADARKAARDAQQARALKSAPAMSDKTKGNIGALQRDGSDALREAGYDDKKMQPGAKKDKEKK